MAWVIVPGSNAIWEYDDAAIVSDTYPDASGITTAGIRSFSFADSDSIQETYIKVRKTGETIERGELSKNYYDGKI